MASIPNPVLAMQDPNYASLLPGRNPTGNPVTAIPSTDNPILPSTGSTSGANSVLPPTNLPATAPASNPYAPGSAVPTFGANSGGGYTTTNLTGSSSATPGMTAAGGASGGAAGSPGVGSFSSMTPKDQARMFDSLKKTYGDGIAHAILDFLQGGAGFNQDAINNLFAALQPGIERGTESLMEQFSTSGNRFGSGAQIGMADYLSQVNLNEGQIESQMYEQSVSNYINTLMGAGSQTAGRIAASPSTMDTLGEIAGLVTGGAQGLSSAVSAASPTADTSILDTIGSLAI